MGTVYVMVILSLLLRYEFLAVYRIMYFMSYINITGVCLIYCRKYK